jgi:hypothetical protein
MGESDTYGIANIAVNCQIAISEKRSPAALELMWSIAIDRQRRSVGRDHHNA